jgi:hypothetical protein
MNGTSRPIFKLPARYDQFVSRFVPGGTNRVRALRADHDTAPAAEQIVVNDMEVKSTGSKTASSNGRAVRHCATALALRPRLGAAIGAWGASAQSARASGQDEPVILGERAPGVAAAAAVSEAAFAAGRADRERARLALQASSKLEEASLLNFFKVVPRAEAVAAAAGRLGWDDGGWDDDDH